MDFGSSHVYLYDNSDEEYVSDDELQGKMGDSDEDSAVRPPAPPGGGFSFGNQASSGTSGVNFGLMTDSARPGSGGAPSGFGGTPASGLFGQPNCSGRAASRSTVGPSSGFGFAASTTNTGGTFGHSTGFGGTPQASFSGFSSSTANPSYGLFSRPSAPDGPVCLFGDGGSTVVTDSMSSSLGPQAATFGTPNASRSTGSGVGFAAVFDPKPAKKKHHWQLNQDARSDAPIQPARLQAKSKVNYHRRADVNVVNVRFDQLIAPSNMHAGEAERCDCGVVMSHISKIDESGGTKIWSCQFCGKENEVDVEREEIPTQYDVTFMLEPAPVTTATSLAGADESLVVFCVDISGSMCQTTEVQGDIKLKGDDRLQRLQSLNTTHESQYLPRQRRHVTYVSRLQGVQAAMDFQLSKMAKDHPNRRVALVTFDSEVVIIGDGSSDPITVAGDRLLDKDELVKIGTDVKGLKPIKDTKDILSERLWSLEEGGQTALGPAMAISIAIASQHRGSKVIMCTDGAANIGVGSLDNQNSMEVDSVEPSMSEQEIFYTELTTAASSKGVSVSVVTIKGTECGMVHLGRVASDTGGQVNIVDPLKLTEEFGNILANPVIATNVKATFIVHKQLYIRDTNDEKKNKIVREVGNVTEKTVESFEYGFARTEAQQSVAENIAPDADPFKSLSGVQETGAVGGPKSVELEIQNREAELKEIPFQLQIQYTDREGAKALRVMTLMKPITKSREVAEQNANIAAITLNTKFRSAQLASDGQYGKARKHAMMNQRLVSRAAVQSGDHNQYKAFLKEVQPLDHVISRQLEQERVTFGGLTLSDNESDDEDEAANVRSATTGGGFSFSAKQRKKKKVPTATLR